MQGNHHHCLISSSLRFILLNFRQCLNFSFLFQIYSAEARVQKMNRSLLQRLFTHYKMFQKHLAAQQAPQLNLLLTRNYRTKMEILRFISAVFYDGPDSLIACSEQPHVNGIVPLTFYTAQGREVSSTVCRSPIRSIV